MGESSTEKPLRWNDLISSNGQRFEAEQHREGRGTPSFVRTKTDGALEWLGDRFEAEEPPE